jgi:hypothetical protein
MRLIVVSGHHPFSDGIAKYAQVLGSTFVLPQPATSSQNTVVGGIVWKETRAAVHKESANRDT